MIIDKESNTVYFSDILRTQDEFISTFERIKALLDKFQINYNFLTNTKDIWCRDYMPIQIAPNDFIQFRYEPWYLKNYPHLQSDPRKVLESNKITAKFSNINLDGGNVIRWSDKVILTTRVFKENPNLPA